MSAFFLSLLFCLTKMDVNVQEVRYRTDQCALFLFQLIREQRTRIFSFKSLAMDFESVLLEFSQTVRNEFSGGKQLLLVDVVE